MKLLKVFLLVLLGSLANCANHVTFDPSTKGTESTGSSNQGIPASTAYMNTQANPTLNQNSSPIMMTNKIWEYKNKPLNTLMLDLKTTLEGNIKNIQKMNLQILSLMQTRQTVIDNMLIECYCILEALGYYVNYTQSNNYMFFMEYYSILHTYLKDRLIPAVSNLSSELMTMARTTAIASTKYEDCFKSAIENQRLLQSKIEALAADVVKTGNAINLNFVISQQNLAAMMMADQQNVPNNVMPGQQFSFNNNNINNAMINNQQNLLSLAALWQVQMNAKSSINPAINNPVTNMPLNHFNTTNPVINNSSNTGFPMVAIPVNTANPNPNSNNISNISIPNLNNISGPNANNGPQTILQAPTIAPNSFNINSLTPVPFMTYPAAPEVQISSQKIKQPNEMRDKLVEKNDDDASLVSISDDSDVIEVSDTLSSQTPSVSTQNSQAKSVDTPKITAVAPAKRKRIPKIRENPVPKSKQLKPVKAAKHKVFDENLKKTVGQKVLSHALIQYAIKESETKSKD